MGYAASGGGAMRRDYEKLYENSENVRVRLGSGRVLQCLRARLSGDVQEGRKHERVLVRLYATNVISFSSRMLSLAKAPDLELKMTDGGYVDDHDYSLCSVPQPV